MITRLFIDNYKSLVNFEVKFKQLQLILGGNGSGKSTIFEVLSIIREFVVDGSSTLDLFEPQTLTRWQTLTRQTFELHVNNDGDDYEYRLVIEHDPDKRRSRVVHEGLALDGGYLLNSNDGNVQIYQDNGENGPQFFVDMSRSSLGNVAPRGEYQKLLWFKNWISKLCVVEIDARNITGRTEGEAGHPNRRFINFASWYRQLLQERPEVQMKLYASLQEALEGFEALPLTQYGESVRMLSLRQKIAGSKKSVDFAFNELSDGQRALIVLHALLFYGIQEGITICIDEPDNYIALREIQPWLSLITDLQVEASAQVLMISHHPEIINYLARDCGLVLERIGNGATSVKGFVSDGELEPAEIIARGWNNVE